MPPGPHTTDLRSAFGSWRDRTSPSRTITRQDDLHSRTRAVPSTVLPERGVGEDTIRWQSITPAELSAQEPQVRVAFGSWKDQTSREMHHDALPEHHSSLGRRHAHAPHSPREATLAPPRYQNRERAVTSPREEAMHDFYGNTLAHVHMEQAEEIERLRTVQARQMDAELERLRGMREVELQVCHADAAATLSDVLARVTARLAHLRSVVDAESRSSDERRRQIVSFVRSELNPRIESHTASFDDAQEVDAEWRRRYDHLLRMIDHDSEGAVSDRDTALRALGAAEEMALASAADASHQAAAIVSLVRSHGEAPEGNHLSALYTAAAMAREEKARSEARSSHLELQVSELKHQMAHKARTSRMKLEELQVTKHNVMRLHERVSRARQREAKLQAEKDQQGNDHKKSVEALRQSLHKAKEELRHRKSEIEHLRAHAASFGAQVGTSVLLEQAREGERQARYELATEVQLREQLQQHLEEVRRESSARLSSSNVDDADLVAQLRARLEEVESMREREAAERRREGQQQLAAIQGERAQSHADDDELIDQLQAKVVQLQHEVWTARAVGGQRDRATRAGDGTSNEDARTSDAARRFLHLVCLALTTAGSDRLEIAELTGFLSALDGVQPVGEMSPADKAAAWCDQHGDGTSLGVHQFENILASKTTSQVASASRNADTLFRAVGTLMRAGASTYLVPPAGQHGPRPTHIAGSSLGA
mmetsp:Transcript_1594/g.5002  ORF Transcript_1594/g.5002 Transcript_1594/m.5002 type:complete len:713 (+) Transcript_1594:188-2326(+)